jgi:hypothetical protein
MVYLNHVYRCLTLALVGATISRKIEAAEWGDRVGEQHVSNPRIAQWRFRVNPEAFVATRASHGI